MGLKGHNVSSFPILRARIIDTWLLLNYISISLFCMYISISTVSGTFYSFGDLCSRRHHGLRSTHTIAWPQVWLTGHSGVLDSHTRPAGPQLPHRRRRHGVQPHTHYGFGTLRKEGKTYAHHVPYSITAFSPPALY